MELQDVFCLPHPIPYPRYRPLSAPPRPLYGKKMFTILRRQPNLYAESYVIADVYFLQGDFLGYMHSE